MELLQSLKLCEAAGGAAAGAERWRGAALLGLYFTGSDCSACTKFTPTLRTMYEIANAEGRQFEVVALLRDEDPAKFEAYTAKMPWLALQRGDPRTAELFAKFAVTRLPTLVVLGAGGEELTRQGWKELSTRGEEAFEEWLARAKGA